VGVIDDPTPVWAPIRTGSHARFRSAIAVAIIATVALSAFWKLTMMKGVVVTDDVFTSDIQNESFPYRVAIGRALRSGEWPLWVREIYGGFPLLARSEAGVCYPFNLLLFGLLNPFVALNITILLIVLTAGIGMYGYAREIGCTYVASVMAALAFCLSGSLIAHIKHLSIANVACWLPVGLALLERATKRRSYRSLLWFACVFGLQNLAGNAQIAYYCAFLYLFYFAFRFFSAQRHAAGGLEHTGGTWRQVTRALGTGFVWSFGGVFALGVLLAAVQLIPTYELVSLSQRSGGVTLEYASKYAYDPRMFWTFFSPYWNGDVGDLTYTGPGIFWEDYGYVGLLTVLLAISAPLLRWRDWHIRFFSIAAVTSYLLVLGPATPVYGFVFNHVPGMKYFRFPTRFLLITDASLVVLAAMALSGLARSLARRAPTIVIWGGTPVRVPVAVTVALLAMTVADLLYFQLRQNPIANASAWQKPPKTVEIVRREGSLFRIFSLGGNHAHREAFERAHGWEGDLQPYLDQREFIQPSSNVIYGLASPNGYANLTPNYLVDVWGDQNRAGLLTRTASMDGGEFRPTPVFWKLMRMYNVGFLTSLWPIAPAAGLSSLGVYGGAHLYHIDDRLPRAYLVDGVIAARGTAAAARVLFSDLFDPRRSVLLDETPAGYQSSSSTRGRVELVRYGGQEVDMDVDSERPAVLVFSDSYYPGWVARVDGTEVPIYRANITQRAVVVPAGVHRVTFRFESTAITVGLWISVAALGVLVGLLVFAMMRARREREMVAAPAVV